MFQNQSKFVAGRTFLEVVSLSSFRFQGLCFNGNPDLKDLDTIISEKNQ